MFRCINLCNARFKTRLVPFNLTLNNVNPSLKSMDRFFSIEPANLDPYAAFDELTIYQVRQIAKALGFYAMGTKSEVADRLKTHYRVCNLAVPENLKDIFPPENLKDAKNPQLIVLCDLLVSAKMEPYCHNIENFSSRDLREMALKLGVKVCKQDILVDRLVTYFKNHDKYDPSLLHSDDPQGGKHRVLTEHGTDAFKKEYKRSTKPAPPQSTDTPNELLHLMSYGGIQRIAKKLRLTASASKDNLIPLIIAKRAENNSKVELAKSFNLIEKTTIKPRISAFKKFLETNHLRDPLVTEDGRYLIEKSMDTIAHLKEKGTIPKEYILRMILDATAMFQTMPNVLSLSRPSGNLTVVGDTLGDFDNLLHILSTDVGGIPSEQNVFVFNGNVIDRGASSFKALTSLLLLKLASPNSIHILRGVHETTLLNNRNEFDSEILKLYDQEVLTEFNKLFSSLPLAAVIEEKVFVVHGGLGKESCSMTVDQLNSEINRSTDSTSSGIVSELLWAEPKNSIDGFVAHTSRGVGFSFGPNITRKFLKKNNFEFIIRSNGSIVQDGYDQLHNSRCLTVFSVPDFYHSAFSKQKINSSNAKMPHNYGALIRFEGKSSNSDSGEIQPLTQALRFIQFDTVGENGVINNDQRSS